METKITAGIVIANAFAAPMSIALMKELAQLVILLTHSKTAFKVLARCTEVHAPPRKRRYW